MADSSSNVPGFSLRSVEVKSYRGIRHIKITDLPEQASWIFLTGENGTGKTTLLQAIALGLVGMEEDHTYSIERDGQKMSPPLEIQVSTREQLYPGEDTWLPYESTANKPELPRLFTACYGPGRLMLQAEESQLKKTKNSSQTYGLFYPDAWLLNFEYELKFSQFDRPNVYQELTRLLKAVVPGISRIEVVDREVIYFEKGEDGEEYGPVSFNQLASGYRSMLALAADIYLRIGSQGDNIVPEPAQLAGIVIIDEIDLHLHPKYQRILPGLLSRVFPRIQFIASTHSPIPLLGAPAHSVFLKVNRNKEEGITVQRIEIEHFETFNPNLILTSPIFGFQDIFQANAAGPGDIATEDVYADWKNNHEQVKELLKAHEERVKRSEPEV
jgi:predicted ATPase